MKEQKFLSKNDLKAILNRQKEESIAEWAGYNVIAASEMLSKAINDLREIGVNVQLQFVGNASEDAFSLVQKVSSNSGMTVPMYGILKIDQVEHLLAISVKEAGKDVLKMYISAFDYKGQGSIKEIRGACYDLNEDPEAIQKFQKHIIFTSARNEIIRDHDVYNAFDNEGVKRLNKSSLAPKPQTPPKLDHP